MSYKALRMNALNVRVLKPSEWLYVCIYICMYDPSKIKHIYTINKRKEI